MSEPRIKPDWTMPDPPGIVCDECGWMRNIAKAYNTGGEWLFYWACKDDCDPYDPDYIHMDTWPFVRDYATIEDVKCAGFDIIGG